MANEEHLAVFRQGVEVWNRWRRENPDVQPDLKEADLQGNILFEVDLRGANLRQVDLTQAALGGADLTGADLYRAYLIRTNLQEANLREANLWLSGLWMANLQGANLREANLQGANLREANLQGADLTVAVLTETVLDRTNMTEARVGITTFGKIDLRGVQGLDTIQHRFPSTIGIDTLYQSHGDIPEVFLRGCGIPDSMIDYARSLVTAERPIDYYSCFISYSSHDEALAERLYADLQARGVRCWLAPHDLTPGDVIVRGIDEAIRLHDKVVLLLSESAVMSHWVAYEVNLATTREAREGRTVLYPLRLDDAVLTTTQGWAATLREGRHIGDFREWKEHDPYQAMFGRLLRDLKAEQQ